MITIYVKGWEANNGGDATLPTAAQAAEVLRAGGHKVTMVDDWCENRNVGCDTETDEENDAVMDVYETWGDRITCRCGSAGCALCNGNGE